MRASAIRRLHRLDEDKCMSPHTLAKFLKDLQYAPEDSTPDDADNSQTAIEAVRTVETQDSVTLRFGILGQNKATSQSK